MSTRRALAAVLGVGLLARLVFAMVDDGLWWPDEHYQSVEPAHRAVFGYGWQAWELVAGARHWTLPGFVAAVMAAASALGLPLIGAVKVALCLASGATVAGVFSLARAQGASERAAVISAAVFALMGLAVFAAPRALGESVSALPVTFAFALLLQKSSARKWTLVSAGALLSIAVGLRLQNGLFCLGALAVLLGQRRGRDFLVLLGVLGVGALVYGLVDRLTWGEWFHSAKVYLQFNLVEGKASSFGVEPRSFYPVTLLTAEGVTVVPLLVASAVAARKRPELPLIILAVLIAHSLVPHKELRFIFPVLPLLAAHAALGVDRLTPKLQLAMLAPAVISLATLPVLTFGRLGVREPPPPTSALDYGGPENRLLIRAGQLDDVCGLRIVSLVHWRTGGFAYFHRNAPLYRAERSDDGAGHFNYVIARRGTVEGTEVATDHGVALIRLAASCTPDPSYDWNLE